MAKSKIFCTLFGLLIAATSYAYTPRCGWYVDIEPFYAKATDTLLTNSIFAVKVADPAILGDYKKQYFLNLENSWGGRLALGYDFRCCGNACDGLSIEYTFFNHRNDKFINNDNRDSTGKPVLAPAEFIDITDESSARFSSAHSSLSQNYDTFDLLTHRRIFLRNCSVINAIGGIRYLHLQERLNDNYNFMGFIGATRVQNTYHVHFKNNLNAIGPNIGSQVYYYLGCGFGLTWQVSGSLLYGESYSEFKNSYILTPASDLGPETILTSSNHHDDACHIVPALSGKVAIAYQARLRNCSYMTFELGYRGDKYFNAANDVAYQQLLAGDDINSNSNYHDFDLSGPYFSVTFHS